MFPVTILVELLAAFFCILSFKSGDAVGRNHPTRVLIGYQQNCSPDAVTSSLKLQYEGDSVVPLLETLAANVNGTRFETYKDRTRRAILQSLFFKLNVEAKKLSLSAAALLVQQENWQSLVKERFAETNIDVIEDPQGEASSEVVSLLAVNIPCLSFPPHPDIIFTSDEFFGPDISADQNDVISTTPQTLSKSNIPNDPAIQSIYQYYLSTAGILHGDASVWSKTIGNITIGVVDGGCSFHPELASQYWIDKTVKECVDATPSNPKLGSRCYGFDAGEDISALKSYNSHGTAVAGFIAAATNNGFSVAAPCWGCKIACVKIANAKNELLLSYAIAGINWLIEKNIKISNHSYNAYVANDAKAYEFAFNALMAPNNHLFVTAAGNESCDIDAQPSSRTWTCSDDAGVLYRERPIPATYTHPNMLVVGSIGESMEPSSFSNWGSVSVDIFAPGERVGGIMNTEFAQLPEGWKHLKRWDGTSFSSPLTAGIAALVWSANPQLTANDVKTKLMSTAKRLPGFKDLCVSGGMVDASAALEDVTKTLPLPPPTAPPTKDLTSFFYGKRPGKAATHVPSMSIAVVMLMAWMNGLM